MHLIDAVEIEREGWYINRIIQTDKNTMEYQTKKPTEFPAIEPERKTGEWIFKGYGEYRCSSCRRVVDLDMEILMSIESFNYCPYCGSYNGGNTETE